MPELAPLLDCGLRRAQRLEQLRRGAEQIARLQVQQRLEIAALAGEDLAGLTARYVPDELALVLGLSVRQAGNRVDDARCFADFPAVHAKVADGTWLLEHADAVISELAGSGLDHAQQQQVLDLVLSRRHNLVPYELRTAVRTATVVLFPEHVLDRAEKAKTDRDVRSYVEAPGVASLHAYGPAADIAAMMACLDAMTVPADPDDPRSLAQRRFDTLRALVAGQLQPGNWQAIVLVGLATIDGHDELPGEIAGFGPIPAPMAREIIAAGAALRRVIVDEHGQLVAVDDRVHRPDLPPDQPPRPAPRPSPDDDPDDDADADGPASGPAPDPGADQEAEPDDEPDDDEPCDDEPCDDEPAADEPCDDEPAADDLAWLDDLTDGTTEDTTDGTTDGTTEDTATAPPLPGDDTVGADSEHDGPCTDDVTWFDDTTDRTTIYARLDQLIAPATCPALAPQPPLHLSWQWSQAALSMALHRIGTDPIRYLDLHSDNYAVPTRLKRFLELRDRTCIFPGCPRKAMRCDKDHLIPWPLGPTSAYNLANECEHHHQGKHGCLTVKRLPDGTFRWTTPCGITADRPPRPVLDAWTYRPLPEPPDAVP